VKLFPKRVKAPTEFARPETVPTARKRRPGARPTVAVLTMTRDEGHMLRRWVDYYGAQIGRTNLYVFDDNSSDGSTDNLGCAVHRLPKLPGAGSYELTRLRLMNGVAAGLLAVYDYVIFVDVDEFLIPDPDRFANLIDFLVARPDRDVIAGAALNVVHHVGLEPDIDPSRPVLDQRSFAKFVPLMCKPSIKRVPAGWVRATHGIAAPYEVDPELFMIHLKFHDRAALRELGNRRRAVVDVDGRARDSSWGFSGDEIAAQLTEFVGSADPDTVPEFRPDPRVLKRIPQPADGCYRSAGLRQIPAMQQRPLVRVPARLAGKV
jgi:hypothetical protein